ncbi:MAG: PKD domain-containing protein, partial [Thermoplasmata archaeon]|nr:PKD domain-containing protein [Thermoplasmata archaeon]
CGAILPPPAGPGGITSLGGGYRMAWVFPAGDVPMVRNFSLVAVPASGAGVVATVPNAATRTAVVTGLRAGVGYTLYIGLTTVDGQTLSVGRVPGYPSSPVLAVFQATASSSASALTQPNAATTLSFTAAGGHLPYSFHVAWGNGTSTWLYNAGASATLPRNLPGYLGVARILVRANDSVGDVVAFAAIYLEVRATALGVSLALSAGENRVGLTWSAPASPTSPVTSYSVFFTEDPLGVGILTNGWPNNGTGAHPVVVFNTTKTSAFFSAIDGEPLYAAVVAWTALGPGLLPSTGVSSATPAPFTLLSFGPQGSASLGGPAPLTVPFSAEAASGGFDPVFQADLSVFALSLDVTATPSTIVGPSGTTSWANASVTFPTAGSFRVALHLEDAMFDPPLVSLLTVYVGPGAAPDLAVSITTPAPFAGHPVDLVATASGTPGPYTLSWQFGDGSSLASAGAMVSHTYAVGGAYTVTVTAKDNGTLGRVTVAQPVEILSPPTVRIIAAAGPAGVLAWSFQAYLQGGSGTPILAWSFGDGLIASGAWVNHTFTKVGTYTIRLNLTDPSGLTATDSREIRVGTLTTPGSAPASSSDTALLGGLVIGLIAAAMLAVIFYLRGRPPKTASVADPATYTMERSRPATPPVDEG